MGGMEGGVWVAWMCAYGCRGGRVCVRERLWCMGVVEVRFRPSLPCCVRVRVCLAYGCRVGQVPSVLNLLRTCASVFTVWFRPCCVRVRLSLPRVCQWLGLRPSLPCCVRVRVSLTSVLRTCASVFTVCIRPSLPPCASVF
jgi:hypothetical protein